MTGLPASGTLYVRLYSYINSAWQYNDYTYTIERRSQGGDVLAHARFDADEFLGHLQLDDRFGCDKLTGSMSAIPEPVRPTSSTTAAQQRTRTVTGLPASGTLNVRLWSYMSGGWQYNDYTYTMNSGTKAVMSSPTPGSTLTNTSATFNWTNRFGGIGPTGSTSAPLVAGSTNIFKPGRHAENPDGDWPAGFRHAVCAAVFLHQQRLAVQRLHLHHERRSQGGDVLADARFDADEFLGHLQLDDRFGCDKLTGSMSAIPERVRTTSSITAGHRPRAR